MTFFKPHLESRCTLPLPPSLTAQPSALRPFKDLLSAGTGRALKIRERILPPSRPGHFIPRNDTLGAISYELFSARLWPRWGPRPRLLPGLRVIAALSYGIMGGDLQPPPPRPGAPHFCGSALLPPPPPVLLRVYCTETLVGQPVVLLPGSSLQKTLHTPLHCGRPRRILCLWKVSSYSSRKYTLKAILGRVKTHPCWHQPARHARQSGEAFGGGRPLLRAAG